MKSTEFIIEGDDKNINDVQVNHPEVYQFIVGVVGSMALNKQSMVSTYDTPGQHHVIIRIQPAAGLRNTAAGLAAEGHKTWSMDDMIQGATDGFKYRITDDHQRNPGNITERWQFILPTDAE
jgi:hypothetical protein